MQKLKSFLHRYYVYRTAKWRRAWERKGPASVFAGRKPPREFRGAGNGAYCRMRYPGNACGHKTSRIRTVRGGGLATTSLDRLTSGDLRTASWFFAEDCSSRL